MTQCPECRSLIPDDSAFCDQCGKELKWCPQCGRPKRGTECPVCGNTLIPGTKWLAAGGDGVEAHSAEGGISRRAEREERCDDRKAPAGSEAEAACPSGQLRSSGGDSRQLPTSIVGNGWKLLLREGQFGRVGGIWPELAGCPYVSGNHGRIGKTADGWTITDNGSTNGTYINGQKIAVGVPTPVKKGDTVRIATLDFTVE